MRKTHSKSNIVLMELLICILFFSLSAAICIKTFSVSYSLSKESTALTGSILAAQGIAEVYKAEGGNIDKVAEIFEENPEENTLAIFYDEKWHQTKTQNAPNKVIIMPLNNNEAFISAFNNKNHKIFSLHIKQGDF